MCYIYGSCVVLIVWHTTWQYIMPCTNLDILLNALVIGSTSEELHKESINSLTKDNLSV